MASGGDNQNQQATVVSIDQTQLKGIVDSVAHQFEERFRALTELVSAATPIQETPGVPAVSPTKRVTRSRAAKRTNALTPSTSSNTAHRTAPLSRSPAAKRNRQRSTPRDVSPTDLAVPSTSRMSAPPPGSSARSVDRPTISRRQSPSPSECSYRRVSHSRRRESEERGGSRSSRHRRSHSRRRSVSTGRSVSHHDGARVDPHHQEFRAAGENTVSGYAALSDHVSVQVRDAIWQGIYIPLAALRRENAFNLNILFPSPKEPKTLNPISTLQEWIHLFLTFIAIRLQSHPMEAIPLINYQSHIMRLSVRSSIRVALQYDGHFRMQRATHPIPWDVFRVDILFEVEDYLKVPSSRPRQPFPNRGGARQSRVCYRFNSEKGCLHPKCIFDHTCTSCGKKGHPKTQCASQKRPNPK